MAALRALHPDREARGYSQKHERDATRELSCFNRSVPRAEVRQNRSRPSVIARILCSAPAFALRATAGKPGEHHRPYSLVGPG
jgi:hypothetical protein